MADPKGDPVAAIMLGLKNKDGGPPPGPDEGGGDDLDMAAQDLVDAVQQGDVAGVAAALQAAFGAIEAQPHDEAGPPLPPGQGG